MKFAAIALIAILPAAALADDKPAVVNEPSIQELKNKLTVTTSMLTEQQLLLRDWQTAALTEHANLEAVNRALAQAQADTKKAQDELDKARKQCENIRNAPPPAAPPQ